ncbi:testis-specific serine/threonine-protein kinase 3-like [Diadema antillarum]|uniref:testis-specific serine/threonine-protein kinase 3-like n=1 Tax=Diadema antillarum TaxID=105358 RepID=UPI003A874BF9
MSSSLPKQTGPGSSMSDALRDPGTAGTAGTTSVRRVINEEVMLSRKGYTLGLMLGEGSYAAVYSCQLNNNRGKCAIKIVNRKKAPKDFLEKFLPREMKILSQVKHRNIVKCYDIFDTGNKVYMVLELAGHGDLLDYIKLRRSLSEDKARAFFTQMVDGVSYIHSLGIVHRDMKCENILLDNMNVIKISDFGFARFMEPRDLSKTYCGSAAYAAPEILKGNMYNGKAYDVWSLGIILYIMVCGTMPFDDSNIKRMIKDQLDQRLCFTKKKEVSLLFKDAIFAILQPIADRRLKIDEIPLHPWMEGGNAASTSSGSSQGNSSSGFSASTSIPPNHLITAKPSQPPTPTPATSNLADNERVVGNNNAATRSTPPLREDRSSDSTSRFAQNQTRRKTNAEPGASAVSSASQGSTNSPMTSRTVDVGRSGRGGGHRGRATPTPTPKRQPRNHT